MADAGTHDEIAAEARDLVREVRDYPEQGVVFKDITPVLSDGRVFREVVEWIAAPYHDRVDVVVAIEARGFILGAPVANMLGVGLVPVRKLGKLPGETVSEEYALEYGNATLEMHADALHESQRALVVDDVIATGGTAMATIDLILRAGARVAAVGALLSIEALGGMERLSAFELRVLVDS